eukprot:4675994-Amphidinium_carterae.1
MRRHSQAIGLQNSNTGPINMIGNPTKPNRPMYIPTPIPHPTSIATATKPLSNYDVDNQMPNKKMKKNQTYLRMAKRKLKATLR